ncbi:type II secretion system protein [Janthinobacterium sp. GMG1]|uniref:pilus assembly FimT family protein n=1 Tax=Janthinobacterium sp. GMG1 TaxID=3096007 RepID=UPI002ACA1272|nr:type II secretion system protein [Janthinobacterium sp. GMG1]MDZ5634928.1 type II secretion system protein [Janthinobacterium sp. GMG1]
MQQPPTVFPHRQAGPPRPLRRTAARGFTLIELVAVLVLAGLLATFAVNRFFQRDTFDARSFADQVTNIVRYGQKLAVAQNRAVFVSIDANKVALCFDAGCSDEQKVVPPTGSNSGSKDTVKYCTATNWLCEGRPASVTLSTDAKATPSFYFDALGQPYVLANVFPDASTFPARLQISIQGDGLTRTVTVEGETGYVH